MAVETELRRVSSRQKPHNSIYALRPRPTVAAFWPQNSVFAQHESFDSRRAGNHRRAAIYGDVRVRREPADVEGLSKLTGRSPEEIGEFRNNGRL